ncbi:MAG: RNA-guided endonuclease TnpB family protein [Trichodesmium sp. St2_bin6]|nr:transposase [Trichodesmium sp. MAG_R01]MDE5067821.1 RNA-guided endonuclease TnpB family protein [Trichodesmium sp. St4_bin8_1]MDE5079073.1 RNA-guided endonuclease TnpB family protein [Trichodesmium sp. St2_bin6]MDE5092000.1 RNA-guided endonuclease TnpB family protein [Trichodesmium sp. St18_bin3_1_1]MDE5105310.1 RNA-guided endonuclease TnpB family protein [Trichodesmium sp. St19_bin2]
MVEKAYRFRFYHTPQQTLLLRRTLGCVRLVYNKALAVRTQAWYEYQERVGYKQTSPMLINWKKQEDLDFLTEISIVPLQQGLRHLQTAFNNFFSGRTKYPKFKKKCNGGSAELTKAAFKCKDGQVYIDLGINSLVTTSDGEKVVNPKNLQKLHKKLRRDQKSLSRKRGKKSNNYQKARLKIAKIHALIKDSRLDYTHKLTTQLIRENQTIVVEDLVAGNMVKNHKLARVISDANWGELLRQLEYKAKWHGRTFIKIKRYFLSSKRCSNCGHVVEKLPLNIREWDCPECASHHDRDINASINILAASQAVSVWVVTVRPEESKSQRASAMKQKALNTDAKESLAVSSMAAPGGCQLRIEFKKH